MTKTIRVTFIRDEFYRLTDRSDTTYEKDATYDLPATEAREHMDAGAAVAADEPAEKKAVRGKVEG